MYLRRRKSVLFAYVDFHPKDVEVCSIGNLTNDQISNQRRTNGDPLNVLSKLIEDENRRRKLEQECLLEKAKENQSFFDIPSTDELMRRWRGKRFQK